jgi:hypothetical protein
MKVTRLSALRTGGGMIKSMKITSDPIADRTRDLPACSAVPQSTAPPRTPISLYITYKSQVWFAPVPLIRIITPNNEPKMHSSGMCVLYKYVLCYFAWRLFIAGKLHVFICSDVCRTRQNTNYFSVSFNIHHIEAYFKWMLRMYMQTYTTICTYRTSRYSW